MHKGLMTSLSLYPMKHLVDLFVPYGSFLETKVLLASMSSMLNSFFFVENAFFYLFVAEIYGLPTHSCSR